MDELVVLGGGGHAKVLISLLKKTSQVLVGYTDVEDRGPILGTLYLGRDDILPELIRSRGCCRAAMGLGKIDASPARRRLRLETETLGYSFPVIISSEAVVNEEVQLGAGTVVFDGAVVNSGTVAGDLCIINTNSTVEHDCQLGENVHVAPGATIGGGVTLGDDCMVGAGATIIQQVSVCAGCIIGAGSTVIADITASGTYVGNPARRVR